MSNYAELIIKIEESFRARPYYCSENFPTIGYGEVVGAKHAPLPNITRTKEEATIFVRKRINEIVSQLSNRKPQAWSKCNEARQAILTSMCYQMGINGVLAFNNMWSAIERGDFDKASAEMVNSKWYQQTKNRAVRHVQQMKSGTMNVYYLTQGTIQ